MTITQPANEDLLFPSDIMVSYGREVRPDQVTLRISVPGGGASGSEVFESNIRDVLAGGDPFQSWWLSFLQGNVPISAAAIRRPLRTVDLFCSAGGLSLGIESAGRALGLDVSTALAADIDARALEVFAANHDPDVAFFGSVGELVTYNVIGLGTDATFSLPPQLTSVGEAHFKGRVDLVSGGPPCQGNSSLNTRTRHSDPRNELYLSVAAFGIAVDAPLILIENVPGVRNDRQVVVETTKSVLRTAGYRISEAVLSAADLGWPQTRRRYFLAASKLPGALDISVVGDAFRASTRPVSFVLKDLLEAPQSHILDRPTELSEENQRRIQFLVDSGSINLPNHLRPDCHRDGHTYPSVYGRMLWDAPAGTITTGFQSPGRGRFIHPLQPRTLTPREAARIQGFPDVYFESISSPLKAELAKWIGDAVPPIMGMVASLGLLLSHAA